VRCPICEEEVSSFDTQHMKMKHPEYYLESKRWRNAAYVPLFPIFISVMLYIIYFFDKPLTLLSGAVIAIMIVSFATEFYVQYRVIRLIGKYRGRSVSLKEIFR